MTVKIEIAVRKATKITKRDLILFIGLIIEYHKK